MSIHIHLYATLATGVNVVLTLRGYELLKRRLIRSCEASTKPEFR